MCPSQSIRWWFEEEIVFGKCMHGRWIGNAHDHHIEKMSGI